MDRKKFFDFLRTSTLFKNGLSNENVIGIEAILDAAIKRRVEDKHHVANILGQAYRETGGYMMPIKETVYASHKDKNPPDAEVIKRLNAAYAKGQLSWVKTPYWRDGWFGRGQLQITHENNYDKLGKAIGVDLVSNPSKALLPNISADIAVVGMTQGLFTGKKLSDFKFPEALDAPVASNPRRIVNGNDGSDKEVAKNHRVFYDALVIAGYDLAGEVQTAPPTVPATTDTPEPQRTRSVIIAEIEALLKELKSLGG